MINKLVESLAFALIPRCETGKCCRLHPDIYSKLPEQLFELIYSEFERRPDGGARTSPVESVRACRFTPLQLNFAASWLRDGERFIDRGPGSVNGDGAVVHIAIPDADVRRVAAGVVVSGEGDAAGICC